MNQKLLNKWLSESKEKPEKKLQYNNITLPPEYTTFEGKLDFVGNVAYRYLTKERGLSKDLIKAFKIGYCSSGKYYGRIIMPIFDKHGTVVYYNARNILTDLKDRVKYYDPLEKGSSIVKRSLVPMEIFIDKTKPVVLVEGLFDFYNTPNSIPIMGTNIFSGVLQFILSDDVKEVILSLDGEAFPKVIQYAKMLTSFNKVVRYIPFPEGVDPGSLSYDKMRKLIQHNSRVINDLEILKLKLYGYQSISSI